MPGLFDYIKDFFDSFDEGDDDPDEVSAELDPEDWEGADELEIDAEEWESEYILDEPMGEAVNLPPMDYETALNYCSDAPEGVLMMWQNEDGDYEVYRTYED